MSSSPLNDLDKRIDVMRENMDFLTQSTPWAKALGFKIDHIEKGRVRGHQPYGEHLIGDPRTGVVHGGVITTFLDQLCGGACAATLPEFRFVATLDLRIDYMGPAEPNRDILGEAECYHLTKTVAFVRAYAFHETREDLIATAQAAFAINKPRQAVGHKRPDA